MLVLFATRCSGGSRISQREVPIPGGKHCKFRMPQIPSAFEFKSERLSGNGKVSRMAKW